MKIFFGQNHVLIFVNNVTDSWLIIAETLNIYTSDKSIVYSLKLKTSTVKTDGPLEKLCIVLIIFPHSIVIEGVVSHYNQIKTCNKINVLEELINNRLYVSLKGIGTAHPRSAIIEFLNKKERRFKEPDLVFIKIEILLIIFLGKKMFLPINIAIKFFQVLFVIYYYYKINYLN